MAEFRVEYDSTGRDEFGWYKYKIFKDNQLIAYYSHDHRGDNAGIEFLDGRIEQRTPFPTGDFLQGGGPMPLELSPEAIAFLTSR